MRVLPHAPQSPQYELHCPHTAHDRLSLLSTKKNTLSLCPNSTVERAYSWMSELRSMSTMAGRGKNYECLNSKPPYADAWHCCAAGLVVMEPGRDLYALKCTLVLTSTMAIPSQQMITHHCVWARAKAMQERIHRCRTCQRVIVLPLNNQK